MQPRHEDRRAYFQELAITGERYFLPYIHHFMPVPPQSRILEIGCGEGGNLVPFARLGCRVEGIDLSENRIRQARRFFQEEGLAATFVASDIFQVTPPEEVFDVILLHDVIEHISEKGRLPEAYQTIPCSLRNSVHLLPCLANAFWWAPANLPEQVRFASAFHPFTARRLIPQSVALFW